MKVLDQILAHKRETINEQKQLVPQALLEKSLYFKNPTVSLKNYILRPDKQGIIAELKRKSPSNPEIKPAMDVEQISIGYMQSGASALSVLTDHHFFGGSNDDLITARKYNFCPILRKDFIIDAYQVIEAKSIGADAILLIAAALKEEELLDLAKMARGMGLEVLLEIHDREEITDRLLESASIIGVNNRNLKTMQVSLDVSMEMAKYLPEDVLKISESGIRRPADVIQLRGAGYRGFLIGELFMQQSRPEKACMRFIEELSKLQSGITHEA
jgi:indole-3-glycerol phosphate synthase